MRDKGTGQDGTCQAWGVTSDTCQERSGSRTKSGQKRDKTGSRKDGRRKETRQTGRGQRRAQDSEEKRTPLAKNLQQNPELKTRNKEHPIRHWLAMRGLCVGPTSPRQPQLPGKASRPSRPQVHHSECRPIAYTQRGQVHKGRCNRITPNQRPFQPT